MLNDIAQLKISIVEFQPDPNQPRKYFDETSLNNLPESIKQFGVLQPIILSFYRGFQGIRNKKDGYP